jgi:hypothetical protein
MTTFGEPRPGTEAYFVKQEVIRKQKIVRERGLDKLFSDVYHEDGLQNYETWFNSDHNKRWVHPDISLVVNGRDQVSGKEIHFVEFSMAGQEYKVTCREWLGEGGTYNDLTLYMNGRRVFEIHESVDSGQYSTAYRPSMIDAYVNDDWVSDFNKLKEHHQKVSEQATIEYAEDTKRLQETKDAFGIGEIANTVETSLKRSDISPTSASSTPSAGAASTSGHKLGTWIVIAIFVILAVLWATK